MASVITPIAIPADSATEATRKGVALAEIATLSASSLAIIAKAAKKPGADAKLHKFQNLL